jgi:Polyketide cyclase / dehydrase and lipid transport
LKLIIASLIVFSLVILFLFALFPSDISVSRMIQINATKSRVSKQISDFRTWKTWNVLLQNPPAKDLTNSLGDKTDSGYLKIGGMSVELLSAGPDTVVTRWQQGTKSFTGNYMLTEMSGRVILEWTLHFHINWYPWEKLASMFYEKKLGPLMESSLINLQKELEEPVK